MASVELTLDTIAGGELVTDFESALRMVNASFNDPKLAGGEREISIKIKFKRESAESPYVKTEYSIGTKLPERKQAGMSWLRDDGMFTESLCIGGDGRQMTFGVKDENGNVTPLGRRSKRED